MNINNNDIHELIVVAAVVGIVIGETLLVYVVVLLSQKDASFQA